jgi:hypothetical protein
MDIAFLGLFLCLLIITIGFINLCEKLGDQK